MSFEILWAMLSATKQKGFIRFYLWYSALGGLVLLLIVALASYRHAQDSRYLTEAHVQDTEARLIATEDRVTAALSQQHELQTRIETLSNALKQPGRISPPIENRLTLLQNEVEKLQKQLDGLDELLGDDPVKRMSVILLTRDVEQLKDATAKDSTSLRAQYQTEVASLRENSRSDFELMKWAFGFVGASNLIMPALAFFFQGRSPRARPHRAMLAI